MAEILFRAFLSCSLADEDERVLEFFRELIGAFDLTPTVYDYQEIGRIPDKVKELIIRSDCLIAIATRRRKIEGTNYWTCSDWIQHELALASAYGKPIAIFTEDGVKIEGYIGMEERRERFDRDNLTADVAKLATFLFKLRKYLESTYEVRTLQVPLLMRHYLHAIEEIASPEILTVTCESLMESLVEGLEATHHTIGELDDKTPGLSVKPVRFDFKCKECPSATNVTTEVMLDADHKFLWKVVFNPPLKKGEKVRYAWKAVLHNFRPYTYEEAMRRISAGTYAYSEPVCGVDWTIAYPTAELQVEVTLPEEYEIGRYHPDVRIGEVRIRADDELKRIQEGNFFLAEKVFDKWMLRLKVPKPVQDNTYYIFYEPQKT